MKNQKINSVILMAFLCFAGKFNQKNAQSTVSKQVMTHDQKARAVANILSFPTDKQPALNLCWAAVTSNVSKFYDVSSIYQVCDLANNAVGSSDCCNNLGPCDKSWYLDKALSYTNNLKEMDAGVPSLDLIENQITNGSVVCLRIEWRGTDCGEGAPCGHFIVIYGYSSDGNLYIYDPWPTSNPPVSNLTDLASFYQNVGQITHYYLTKKATE